MDALNRGDDSQTETRLLDTLITASNALTLRELTQCTGLRRKAIEEALRSLVDAGLVSVERRRRGERGPEATLFRAVSENP
jgi:predicted transcriptional regulator